MRILLIILFLLIISIGSASGQQDSLLFVSKKTSQLQSGLVTEVGYQNMLYMSAGGMVGKGFGKENEASLGAGMAFEVLYGDSVVAFGPKIFVTGHLPKGIGFRVGVSNYRQKLNTFSDFRLWTEISYSYKGMIGVNAGFSLPLKEVYSKEIGTFRVGLTLNLMR